MRGRTDEGDILHRQIPLRLPENGFGRSKQRKKRRTDTQTGHGKDHSRDQRKRSRGARIETIIIKIRL